MNEHYELDDPDRELMGKIRIALEGYDNGDPAKDFIDEDEMMAGLRLLVEIADAGFAK